jgi:hypothetical protein
MVKDFPIDHAAFMDSGDHDPVLVPLHIEAPARLRTAAVTLLELDRQGQFDNWFSRRWRRFLAGALYRLADKVEGPR